MNKIFRKAITVLGSVALIGATVGAAAAAAYPAPFTSNTAVVYGANAAFVDQQAAMDIVANLDSAAAGTIGTTLVGGDSITETEVTLRALITTDSDISTTIESGNSKTKLTTLAKEKLSWDDGTGSSDYDVEERIVIGNMKPFTRLDDKNLDEDVALTNQEALQYQLYFKNLFNTTLVNSSNDDSDSLYLTILGKEYEILSIPTNASIQVVTSEEVSVGLGESVTVQGKTFTVDDLSSDAVKINGQTITNGNSKKIDGLQVKVNTGSIFYNSNFPEQASVTLKIGEDISKTYTSGTEYIGEDSKDPLWTWNISLVTGAASYIGVDYSANIDREKAAVAGDKIKYAGEAYTFPNNFGQVVFDGLTDVNYQDLTISFEDGVGLYNNSDSSDTLVASANVLSITAEDVDVITVAGEETDKIFIYYNTTAGAVQTFYRDWDGDSVPSGRMRLANASALSVDVGNATAADASGTIATVKIGETDFNIVLNITGNTETGATTYLKLVNTDDSNSVVLQSKIGGTLINATAGAFEQFGVDAEATATALDAVFSESDVSTQDYSYMDAYGVKIADGDTVQNQVEDDRIILAVPEDQVYAIISVVVGGEATTTGEAGALLIKDTALSSAAGKNLVVVGGSAINAAAAELLGAAYSEGDFTAKTGVAAGEFLIQSFNRGGKTALLVAGYNAADTENAAAYLLNVGANTAVGTKIKGVSATQATVVTA